MRVHMYAHTYIHAYIQTHTNNSYPDNWCKHADPPSPDIKTKQDRKTRESVSAPVRRTTSAADPGIDHVALKAPREVLVIHTCTHTYIHPYIHTYNHTRQCIQANIQDAYIPTSLHTYIPTYIYIIALAHVHVHVYVYVCVCMCMCMYLYLYLYMYL